MSKVLKKNMKKLATEDVLSVLSVAKKERQ